jgi:hypothetical protein
MRASCEWSQRWKQRSFLFQKAFATYVEALPGKKHALINGGAVAEPIK